MGVAITGARGHLGQLLTRELARDPDMGPLLLVDRHGLPGPLPPAARPLVLDLAGGPAPLIGPLAGFEVAVHLAWQSGSGRANLAATRHFLEACAANRVRRVLVASATAAYGAWPEAPVPIAEAQWVRADQPSPFGRQKALVEGLCRQWAEHHPYASMIIVRLGPVVGPELLRSGDRHRSLPVLFAVPEGSDPTLQFVHEDDAARALAGLCQRGSAGAYNVAADGTVPVRELAALFGRRTIPAPASAPRVGAGSPLARWHPWVADNRRLKATLGFEFGKDSLTAVTELARCLRSG